jgi:hypothetical protein
LLPVQSERKWDIPAWLQNDNLPEEPTKKHREEIRCCAEEEHDVLVAAGDSLAHAYLISEKA